MCGEWVKDALNGIHGAVLQLEFLELVYDCKPCINGWVRLTIQYLCMDVQSFIGQDGGQKLGDEILTAIKENSHYRQPIVRTS